VVYAFARIAMAILALGVLLMLTSVFARPSLLLLAILAPVSVAFGDRTAVSLLSRAHGAFASKRAKHQLSLVRFGLLRPLGGV
jgi:hypothetical protein